VWLLLHGVPLSPRVWDEVRGHLDGKVLTPDLTEMTRSAPGNGVLQREIAEAVLADLPAGDAVVVGHSFGGQVALELALLAPQRVQRLIIVCSRHTPFPAFDIGARAIGAGEPFDIDAGMRRWFRPAELAADGPAVRYTRHQIASAPRGPWAAGLAAVAHYDRSAAVGRIGMPTALFAAGHDEVATPAVMAELAAALPDAALEVVNEWAHMSPFADPAGLAARLTGRSARYPLRRE
jgi:pimeloyl-ACP methyl ester carboxylesterase